MTEQERAFALNEWHLGSMNDGLFIIDTPPRPSTDEVHHDRTDGPTMVLNITDLPHEKAQAIVDAHNRALRLLAATPAASSEVRERVARAMAIADGSKDPDALFAPPQTMNSPRDPYPVWMEWLGQADASLSAISPGDEIGDCVLAPKEPSDAQIAAMDQILDEMRETDDGWPVSDVVTLYKAALAAAKETTR